MKKILIITTLILIIIIQITFLTHLITNPKPIYNETINQENIIIKNKIYNYYEELTLEDIISLNEGNLNNLTIDTTTLGNKTVDYTYTLNKKTYQASLNYDVVDTEQPYIANPYSYTIVKGTLIDPLNSILIADNYDKKPNCNLEGSYDTNTIGSYNLSINCTDTSNNYSQANFTVNVVETTTPSTYTPTPIYLEDLIKEHKTDKTKIGIDISVWQGDIDFQKVKDAGVEFVIIRIGYGPKDGQHIIDSKFYQNLEGAKAVGLDVGLYYFSYANSVEEAKNQAEFIIETLNGIQLELPISFDWENWNSWNSYNLSTTDLNQMAKVFIQTLEKAGYEGMNYGSANYLRTMWNIKTKTWLAHYTTKTSYEDDYYMWQLSDTGIVDGIDGYVDLNILYE